MKKKEGKKIRPVRPKSIVPAAKDPSAIPAPHEIPIPESEVGPLMIGIPTGRQNINSGTVKSLFSSHPYLMRLMAVTFYSHAGSLVQIARQETLNQALKSGMRWLWFIDDDMTFPAHTPLQLIKNCIDNDFAVCATMMNKRVPPYSPTIGMRDDENGDPLIVPEEVPENGVHEVAHVGMACTIIDLNKIRESDLNKNDNLFYLATADDNKRLIGEDLVFSSMLRKSGLKIGANLDIWSGHMGMHEFRPDIWYQVWRNTYLQKKNEESLKKRETAVVG